MNAGPMGAEDAIRQAVAAERLEGWAPTPSDLEVLAAAGRGEDVVPDLCARLTRPGATPPRRWFARRAPYLQSGSATLRNRFGIEDPRELDRAEALVTAVRLVEIHTGRVAFEMEGVHRLLELHRYVFSDVYEWAGKIRTVELSKNGTTFTHVASIWEALIVAHETIVGADFASADHGRLAYLLSRTYAEVNHAHPFREGNGRAGTALLHHLVADSSYRLDLSGTTRADWVQAARDSVPFRTAGAPSPRPFLPIFLRALVG